MMGGGLGALLLVGGGVDDPAPCLKMCLASIRQGGPIGDSWKTRMRVDLQEHTASTLSTQIKVCRYPASRITMNLYKAQ